MTARAALEWVWEPGSWRRALTPHQEVRIRVDADGSAWVRLVSWGTDTGWHAARLEGLRQLAAVWAAVERPEDVRAAWERATGSNVWPPPRYDEVWAEGVAALERM